MKRLIIAAAALLSVAAGHAVTTDSVTFVCHGILSENHEIVADDDAEGYPTTCFFDDRVLKQVLSVCHMGEWCTVRAIGTTGNGRRNLVMKVLRVQKQ